VAQRHLGFVPVGEGPLVGLGVPADGGAVYVTKDEGTSMVVIDVATETVTEVDLGAGQAAIAFAPDGRRAYVSLLRSDAVAVVDLPGGTVVSRIPVGDEPFGVAVHPDGSRVYVANSSSDTVSVIDTASGTVVDTLVTPQRPRWIALSPDGSRAYVAAANSDTLLVLDTGS
jgi:YVTN family beta-propeller protein